LNTTANKNALKQLHRWISLMQHVIDAKHYIKRTEELAHPHLMRTFDDIWGVLLAFRGAIIAYAKCFASAGKGKIRLEKATVFAAKPGLIAQHQRIIDLRNKYVAHSDDNEMEHTSIEHTDTPSELVIRLNYEVSFPFDRMYELRELIKHLDEYVADGLGRHMKAIERQMGKPVRVLQGSGVL
jgi:hypothetical protein